MNFFSFYFSRVVLQFGELVSYGFVTLGGNVYRFCFFSEFVVCFLIVLFEAVRGSWRYYF